MKKIITTFAAAIALVAVAMALPHLLNAQSTSQAEWNEQYRSDYEVPVGTVYTGRSPFMSRMAKSNSTPATTPKLAPAAKQTATPTATKATKATSASQSNFSASTPKTVSNEITSGLIRLTKSMPEEVSIGGDFACELTITAQGCAANVVVRDTIPSGASYVSSEPAATVENNHITWNIGDMDAGQTLKCKVVLKADKEGTLMNCATVYADARVCATIFVGKPVITIDKSAPATALIGQDVTFGIVVKNTGTAAARGIVVTNAVPAGMSHTSGKGEISFDVGDLTPGQSKELSVTFKANQRGKACNTATATSSNAGKASKDACTTILVPGLKVEKTGTKEQILGRNADYEITVLNTGDTTLKNVAVTDLSPAETSIVTAPGATLNGNKATWTIASIAPGAKAAQSMKLTSKTAGTHCSSVTASSGAVSDSAKACTLWKGIAAVMLEVMDDPDPIQIGESTTYTIKVTNQGFADLNNLKISATFGERIVPVSTAQGSVSGKTVNFPTVAKLAAKQVLTYAISVKGTGVGDSRNKITLTADELRAPVEEEESTTVY